MKRDGTGVIYDVEDFELEHHGNKFFVDVGHSKSRFPPRGT